MECTNNGQIIRAKELDTSFTIPKKRKTETDGEKAAKERKVESVEQESILNNAYATSSDAYPPWPQPMNASTYENLYQLYQQGYGSGNVQNMKILQWREEPKTNKCYKDTYGDLYDESLPRELKELFQPLFCKLCSAQLGSTVNAKLHYASKNHDKKVRKFLIEHSEKTGEPLHKRAHISPAKKKDEEEEYNPRHFHCDVCDLPLTGKIHAESHYMGKNHQKVISGKKAPVGKGHYNEEGKFVRSTTQQNPAGHDGFGVEFVQKLQQPPVPFAQQATSLRCDLCNVSVTSLPQMDMHLQGQKHKKKMRASGLLSPPADSAPQALYTSYRTPSGHFYCKACDVSLNSETQFATHLQSKNHARKNNVLSSI